MVHHHGAPTSKRRNLTPDELRRIFAVARERIKMARRLDHRLAYQMHYAMLNLALGSGGREHELEMSDVSDLHPAVTPQIQGYSPFEDLLIRFGKSHDGGPPKRRTVIATYHFRNQWKITEWYLSDVRPKLVHSRSGDALFLNSRGKRFRGDSMSAVFRDICREAGISEDITFHCLRHTFETRLHESGLDIATIAVLLGHDDERTTKLYDHMGSDIIKRRVLASNRRIVEKSRACQVSIGTCAP